MLTCDMNAPNYPPTHILRRSNPDFIAIILVLLLLLLLNEALQLPKSQHPPSSGCIYPAERVEDVQVGDADGGVALVVRSLTVLNGTCIVVIRARALFFLGSREKERLSRPLFELRVLHPYIAYQAGANE